MTPPEVGVRVLDAVPTVGGPLVVRDRCGRPEMVEAVVAEARRRGLEPVVEHRSNEVLAQHLSSSTVDDWSDEACAARAEFAFDVEATVTLGGWSPDLSNVDPEVIAAWLDALARAERRWAASAMLTVAVAIPGPETARALGMTVAELDALVLPAVCCPADVLRSATQTMLERIVAGDRQLLESPGCRLEMRRGGRQVHVDDGVIDSGDVVTGAVVSNLPGGSVYWTVLEDTPRGSIRLTDGSVLTFGAEGRVTDGPFAGERISHVGIGTNPFVTAPIGWTLVDEHRAGAVFLALGENRYMGGQNASALNVDVLPAAATLTVTR